MISVGLSDTLSVFIATYFWEFKPEQIKWFGLVGVPRHYHRVRLRLPG